MTCVFLYNNALYADTRVSTSNKTKEGTIMYNEEIVKDKIVKLVRPIALPDGGVFTHYSGTGASADLALLRKHINYIMETTVCPPNKQLETIIKNLAAPLMKLNFDFVLVGQANHKVASLVVERGHLIKIQRGTPIKEVFNDFSKSDFVLGNGSAGVKLARRKKAKHSAMDLMRSAYISSNGVNNEWTSVNIFSQRKRYINFTITQKHVDDFNKMNAIQLKDIK